MQHSTQFSEEMLVLNNQIYEYKKGVRRMVLYTCDQRYQDAAVARLRHQNIKYLIRPVGNGCMNLFFGRDECIEAVKLMVDRPLSELTPEEDFILGAMLGYDICVQCERFCDRKQQWELKHA